MSGVSVALCTCNGERFVRQQIQSIAEQTRRPDELVLCDDASDDSTVQIAREIAAGCSFPVRITVNPQRIGPTRNFEQAIAQCSCDIIALCDQDDRWRPGKLQALGTALTANRSAGLVFSDADVVDQDLRTLNYRLWQSVDLDARSRRQIARGHAWDVLLKRNVVTGATMAFRAEYRPMLLPIPADWVHDAWIAVLISAVAGCAMVDEPLIEYRQHQQQILGARKNTWLRQFRTARRMDHEYFRRNELMWRQVAQRLQQHPQLRDPQRIRRAQAKADHCALRARLREPNGPGLGAILAHWLQRGYDHYGFGWRSLAQDLFLR